MLFEGATAHRVPFPRNILYEMLHNNTHWPSLAPCTSSNERVNLHGKRDHLTRTFFSRFFIRAGCSETALQNDAICSDVTRSTRALYAQIARVAVERESTSKVYFRSNSKTPYMRNSTRTRITLSVSLVSYPAAPPIREGTSGNY